MALNKTGLDTDFKSMFEDGGFDTFEEAAAEWASALDSYVTSIVPAANPALRAAAATVLEASLLTSFSAGTGLVQLPLILGVWAASIGASMAPSFVATPPLSPALDTALQAVYTLNSAETEPTQDVRRACAVRITGAINSWMKTGTAVPSGGGAAINWS